MDSSKRHDLVTKLFNDQDFLALTTNGDRVQYVLDRVISYKELCVEVIANIKMARFKSAKSLITAMNYKAQAEAFQKRSVPTMDDDGSGLEQALEAYGKAILYTPPNEFDFLCKLYARKSQVHCEMRQFEAGLYSIEVAIELWEENKCLPKVEYIIIKAKCLKALGRCREASQMITQARSRMMDSDLLEQMQLDLGSNDSNKLQVTEPDPFFTYWKDARCSIMHSPKVGRHYIAADDIQANELILKERPFSIVMESTTMDRCHQCYRKLGHKLYPCRHCIDLVFCDSTCFQRAYDSFHRFECGMLRLIKTVTTPSLHIFRMMSRAGGPLKAYLTEKSLAHYSIDDYLSETAQRVIPEWKKTAEEKSRAYKMATILWAHNEKQCDLNNVHHTVVGIETAVLLDLAHSLRQQRPDMQFFVSFVDTVIVDFRRILCNVFGWNEYDMYGSIREYIANCQCLVGSLINHSCEPNVTWSFEDGVIHFTANRLIHQGEDITITYGPNKNLLYYRRQERLNHYLFACNCKACLHDARNGANLRCRSCSGPVVIESALNLEPLLYGKCLVCYDQYENITSAIEQLKKAKETIKSAHTLALLSADSSNTLRRVIDKTKTIVELSIATSQYNRHHLVLSSISVELMAPEFEQNYAWQDKLQLALLFSQHLVVEVDGEVVNNKMLSNLHFWVQCMLRCIDQFYSQPAQSCTIAESEMWNGMFRFFALLKQAIRSLDASKEESGNIEGLIKQLIASRLDEYQQLVDSCIGQFRPKNAQIKIYGDNMWMRFSSHPTITISK